ncbi:MAG: arabinogalactan endo-1,4-beta-galactosidase [Sphingobacteriales bacterium]|uniref:glycoside hydrolase family 53 protein n=1 Tax=Hydrotalea flava TaxID=714549 RepID=UPI0008334F87|nr:glycosyl hydrolase 53 family protein [Hydrotalea flava]RTL55914.1 MAG: arabinogalactan endo-1,4-beta-galactosidase [Sphingobacteriales bacterium]
MKKIFLFITIIAFCGYWGCSKNKQNIIITSNDTTHFFKGADVSWVTEMEAAGIHFYDSTGTKTDLFTLLKQKGINAIRLRIWVNPTNGWCNTNDVIIKAKRAQQAGMKILLDFHYSDSWADPGKQPKPATWLNLSFPSLVTTLGTYTTQVLQALQQQNITPTWVQIGNEVDNGMLWEDGRASTHMNQFAALIQSGYTAVKSFNTNIKVIVHVSNGYNNSLFRWLFDGLHANGAKWDIIGMSLYPDTANWASYNLQCITNMNDMIARYHTSVMICEAGMPVTQPDICRQFLTDLIQKVRSLPNQQGIGVFYWEPECYNNWQGYTLGAFDNTGKPTVAMNAFLQ